MGGNYLLIQNKFQIDIATSNKVTLVNNDWLFLFNTVIYMSFLAVKCM